MSDQQPQPATPQRDVQQAPTNTLTVGAVDDPAEREADRIADRVLATIARATVATPPQLRQSTSSGSGRIRRAAVTSDTQLDDEADPDGEDEPEGPGQPDGSIHGSIDGEPDDSSASDTSADDSPAPAIARSPQPHLRRSALAASPDAPAGTGAAGGPLEASISRRIQRSLGGGRPLDAPVRDRIQPAFHTDLTNVRVHADASAGTLSREINARAFTVGRNVFFGDGEYQPSTGAGMELPAHELGHVEQQSTGATRRARRTVIHRRFHPAVALSKAHLRAKDAWSNMVGSAIPAGSQLFIDDEPANQIVQQRKVRKDVTWVPAVNVDPTNPVAATGNQIGYIRSSRAAQFGNAETRARNKVIGMLRTAEQRIPGDAIKDQLTKAAHVDFLMEKAVRLDAWNPATGANAATFGAGIGALQAKYDRINEGAEHAADTLAYWREWLHPGNGDLVDILDVKLVESDLHEHGLGVMMVKFRKPPGGAAMFSAQTIVEAVIKPEDKSLEKALLGSQPTSAANQANQLGGLTGNRKIGTLNMEVGNIAALGATPVWSTLVERVRGKSSETMVKEGTTTKGDGALGVIPAFHETLVFAWLAGIDDLHWENVMWVNDVPYLIDADSVLMREHMDKTGSGDKNQSGFSTFNKQESDDNRAGIKALDPVQAKSKLLDEMLNDTTTRDAILLAIKQAIAGQKGRTLPIYTQFWADIRDNYQQGDARHRDALLNDFCTRRFLVGDTRTNKGEGPGLQGTTGINTANDFYDPVAVKAQMKKDMDAAVIPFFEYHYDTGYVTYNGAKIFHGRTLDTAFTELAAMFP